MANYNTKRKLENLSKKKMLDTLYDFVTKELGKVWNSKTVYAVENEECCAGVIYKTTTIYHDDKHFASWDMDDGNLTIFTEALN